MTASRLRYLLGRHLPFNLCGMSNTRHAERKQGQDAQLASTGMQTAREPEPRTQTPFPADGEGRGTPDGGRVSRSCVPPITPPPHIPPSNPLDLHDIHLMDDDHLEIFRDLAEMSLRVSAVPFNVLAGNRRRKS